VTTAGRCKISLISSCVDLVKSVSGGCASLTHGGLAELVDATGSWWIGNVAHF